MLSSHPRDVLDTARSCDHPLASSLLSDVPPTPPGQCYFRFLPAQQCPGSNSAAGVKTSAGSVQANCHLHLPCPRTQSVSSRSVQWTSDYTGRILLSVHLWSHLVTFFPSYPRRLRWILKPCFKDTLSGSLHGTPPDKAPPWVHSMRFCLLTGLPASTN